MISKFLLIVGVAFAIFGFGLVYCGAVAVPSSIDAVMAPNSFWRTVFSFALFSGALHLLFVGLRSNNDNIFGIAPIAFCEAMMGMVLAGNAVPFAEHSPAGNVSLGLVSLGLILLANGLTMAFCDGRRARDPKLATA